MSLQPTRFLPFAFVAGLLPFIGSPGAKALDKRVADIEEQRVQVVEKIKMSVLAIFSRDGQGNVQGSGSGVLISKDGFALTNFHVVAGMPPVMLCGIADGNLYDAVIVGQDKVGDVALIKLLPPKDKPDFKFQPAKLGDSDKCRAGDWSLAAGNPFLLATDFTPTVTFGFISGVNRYQYPEGKFIEYTDCIQIDTSINPGNSGGPLFNMDGELIGINGRGSFDKRSRINSGAGYAISINQIKNFMGHLRAGLQVDHASMGCLVESDQEEKYAGPLKIRTIIKSDTMRRGLEPGDELVTFNGWPVTSVNMFKNKLGIYPKGWRVPVEYRHGSEPKKETLIRLMGIIRQELGPKEKPGGPAPGPGGPKPPKPKMPDAPGAKLYEAKDGFTNYYFNKQERDRILKEFAAHGKFTDVAGTWTIKSGEGSSVNHKRATAEIIIHHKGAKDGVNDSVTSVIDNLPDKVEPLAISQKDNNLKDPGGSGGLLVAMFQYRQLLTEGDKGNKLSAGGTEPYYLPPPDNERPKYKDLQILCDVLRSDLGGATSKWYFATKDETRTVQGRVIKYKKGQLVGFETQVDPDDDPCEVYLLNYEANDGRMLPREIHVYHKDKVYAVLNDVRFELQKAK